MKLIRPLLALALLGSVGTVFLSCAARSNDPDCVSQEALTNLKLILAADQGNVKAMEEQVKAGADVNISDELFGNPLVAASTTGSAEAVKFLLDKGARVNIADGHGMTPLMCAANSGNPEVIKLLLAKGADVNADNTKRHGVNALEIAKYKKHETIVKLLEDAGAK